MNLPDMGLKEALEMLQDMAEKAGVLKNDETLSVDLIAFADAVWAKAYEAGVEYEIQRAYHAEMMTPIEQEESLIRALNVRTQRSNDEQGLDKV